MATVLETIGSREAESPWLSRVDEPAELTVPAEAVAWPLAGVILMSVLFVAVLLALTLYVVLAMAISRLVNIRRVNATDFGLSPQAHQFYSD
jgi:hypothetical protein